MVRLAAGAGLALALSSCGGGDAPPRPAQRPIIAALAPLPGGGLRYGELRSGVVRDLGSRAVLARVPVRSGGQRGLLGLAVDGRRTFAAYVARDGRLVVAQLLPAPRRRVWTGPRTATLANGGHLVLAPGGRLVLGIGDRQQRRPGGLDRALLSLDPDGPPRQRPRVLSRGWNNPFAFGYGPDGRLWVADNSPGTRPERLARGDLAVPRVTVLRRRTAPSGLALTGARELVLCGVVSGALERYRLGGDGRWRRTAKLAACRYAVARLRDGSLVVSADDGLHRVAR